MLGTSSRGGISSVVNIYRDAGLFDKWPIIFLPTHSHIDDSKWIKFRSALSALGKFIMLLAHRNIDLVHVHVASRASFWRKSFFILLTFFFRLPIIIHIHSGAFRHFYEEECGILAKKYIRFVCNRAARIIVPSTAIFNDIIKITSNVPVVIIYNPVTLEINNCGPAHKERGRMILFLGRMVKEKGIFDLLDALSLLRKRFSDVKLVCGGEGNLTSVMSYASKLGLLDAVEVLGWVNDKEKDDLLNKTAVFALPSYFESFGIANLEAMFAGVPVVSSRVGGVVDVIEDGVQGYLVSPGDIKSMSERIGELLDDPGLRDSMGEAGRNKVERCFTAERILPQIESIYSELAH